VLFSQGFGLEEESALGKVVFSGKRALENDKQIGIVLPGQLEVIPTVIALGLSVQDLAE
jgi:hypothetical protein